MPNFDEDYQSAEPCHYGMFPVPKKEQPPRREFKAGFPYGKPAENIAAKPHLPNGLLFDSFEA